MRCVLNLFCSDHLDKSKDKRSLAGNIAGQMLPVISDNLSHLTQVQGTRRDQIGALRAVLDILHSQISTLTLPSPFSVFEAVRAALFVGLGEGWIGS